MFESHRVTNRSRDHSTAWAAENPTIVGDARASAFRLDWSVRRTQCAFLQIFHRNGGWALHAAYVTSPPRVSDTVCQSRLFRSESVGTPPEVVRWIASCIRLSRRGRCWAALRTIPCRPVTQRAAESGSAGCAGARLRIHHWRGR
jgi:hypothetical protein